MRITVDAVRSENIRVSVNLRDAVDQFNYALKRKFDIYPDAYLKNGMICCDERGWRHRSIGTEILKEKPTEEEIEVMRFIDQAYTMLQKLNA